MMSQEAFESHGITFFCALHNGKPEGMAWFTDTKGQEHRIPLAPGRLEAVLHGIPMECHDAVEALYANFWPRLR